MAFTYAVGGDTDRNSLRLEIQDTVVADALFQDEELDDLLDDEPTVLATAARCFEILANRFARNFDFSADGASFKKSQQWMHYNQQARDYRRKSGTSSVVTTIPVDGYGDSTAVDEGANSEFRRDFEFPRFPQDFDPA